MQHRLRHEFVQYVPEHLEPDVLYLALEFGTVVHACCCGCGTEIVTPLSPTDWKLTYDGESVSLHPSIGNWGLPCRSHYWITNSNVRWAPTWTPEQITAGRSTDRDAKAIHYATSKPGDVAQSRWQRFRRWWAAFGKGGRA